MYVSSISRRCHRRNVHWNEEHIRDNVLILDHDKGRKNQINRNDLADNVGGLSRTPHRKTDLNCSRSQHKISSSMTRLGTYHDVTPDTSQEHLVPWEDASTVGRVEDKRSDWGSDQTSVSNENRREEQGSREISKDYYKDPVSRLPPVEQLMLVTYKRQPSCRRFPIRGSDV